MAEMFGVAIAADTEGMIELVVFDSLGTELVVVPPSTYPAVGVSGTGNQRVNIDSAGVVFGLVHLVTEVEGDNRTVVGVHSELALAEEVLQAVAAVQLGGAGPELTAGYVFQMCCRSFWDQLLLLKLFPHCSGSGLMKMIPFVQAEVWPTLSGSQQVLACLLESAQTCGLHEDVSQEI